MAADINVIVDVEPDEAKLLISPIETLVDEWYVARHDRKSRFATLAQLVHDKFLARKRPTGPTAAEEEPTPQQ
ncbi:MAG TPA: hypothetical protein VK886_15590 [Vicinamibacterales bacterium]|nr:hypothetical protein [Vicinamibacterales bacterium]